MDDIKRRVVAKYRQAFCDAGFGPHMIDFSSVDAELVDRLGKTIESYNMEKHPLSQRIGESTTTLDFMIMNELIEKGPMCPAALCALLSDVFTDGVQRHIRILMRLGVIELNDNMDIAVSDA